MTKIRLLYFPDKLPNPRHAPSAHPTARALRSSSSSKLDMDEDESQDRRPASFQGTWARTREQPLRAEHLVAKR